MNLELKRFQISRVGTHKSSMGSKHYFSEDALKNCVNEFNQRKSKGETRAPLFIGHPAETGRRDPLGLVDKLELENGKLYATAYIDDTLLGLVRRGTYKKVSAGFHALGDKLKLDHVAFVNNPAVKGMEALNFSEKDGLIMFSEPFTTDFSEDRNALHAAALAYQATYKCDYEQAVHACLQQQAHDFSEPESTALHYEILDRQAKFGGTYESNLAAIQQQRARGF